MSYKHDTHIPGRPNQDFKAAVGTWHRWYKDNNLLPYLYSPKDFANLKILLRKLKAVEVPLEAFLQGIKDNWYLENASIPLFNSHFNQLVKHKQEPKKEQPAVISMKPKSSKTPEQIAKEVEQIKRAYQKQKNLPGGNL